MKEKNDLEGKIQNTRILVHVLYDISETMDKEQKKKKPASW